MSIYTWKVVQPCKHLHFLPHDYMTRLNSDETLQIIQLVRFFIVRLAALG